MSQDFPVEDPSPPQIPDATYASGGVGPAGMRTQWPTPLSRSGIVIVGEATVTEADSPQSSQAPFYHPAMDEEMATATDHLDWALQGNVREAELEQGERSASRCSTVEEADELDSSASETRSSILNGPGPEIDGANWLSGETVASPVVKHAIVSESEPGPEASERLTAGDDHPVSRVSPDATSMDDRDASDLGELPERQAALPSGESDRHQESETSEVAPVDIAGPSTAPDNASEVMQTKRSLVTQVTVAGKRPGPSIRAGPQESTPEYHPLRHHHGTGRLEPTPPPVLRAPHQRTRSIGTASQSVIERPVTRSHCGYRKLQIVDGEYTATVLVPQCTLGDTDKLEEEHAVQLGSPTPAEERLAQNDMPSVSQLHPALHTKLSRITGPTMLQPYSTDMSPARDRTASAESERWHVFILEASEGSIEYERSTRRLSTRSSLRTPEPNRDRGTACASTPTSRRKRSLSTVTESGKHLSVNKSQSPAAGSAAEPAVSPLRRSTRLRAASQAPSEASDSQEQVLNSASLAAGCANHASKAAETSGNPGMVGDSEDKGPATKSVASGTEDSVGAQSDSPNAPPNAGTRQCKRKLEATLEDEQDEGSSESSKRRNSEAPKNQGIGWSLRRWLGR